MATATKYTWKEGTLDLCMEELKYEMVNASLLESLLAVHETKSNSEDDPCWTISHVPTGRCIVRFARELTAKLVAEQILSSRELVGLFETEHVRDIRKRVYRHWVYDWLDECEKQDRCIAIKEWGKKHAS